MKEMRIMRAIGDIDDAYIDEAAPVKKSTPIRFGAWAKYAGIAAAAVLVVGLGAIAVNMLGDYYIQTHEVSPDVTVDMVFSGNPYAGYDTIEEAAQAVGFGISVPERFGAYTDRHIATILDDMIEVTYYDEAGNEGLRIRKAAGTDDPSGDFNIYETVFPAKVGDRNVTMSGITGSSGTVEIYKAVWTDGKYAYSLTAGGNGLTQSEAENIIRSINS